MLLSSPGRARAGHAVAVILAAVLLLSGCSSVHSTPKPTPVHASSALSALLPVAPRTLTAATAKTETTKLADSIDSLIASTDIVYVDDHSQLISATKSAGSYYGILRTITVSTSLDPVQQATAMETLLVQAGWIKRDTTTATGRYLAAMSSSSDGSKAWFLLLGGDSTVAEQPVITVQLASPDLPTK
jgi:hypothetical protein